MCMNVVFCEWMSYVVAIQLSDRRLTMRVFIIWSEGNWAGLRFVVRYNILTSTF